MKHIADGEGGDFVVTNVNPDFCRVDGAVVPYEISQTLNHEKGRSFAQDFFSRGEKVLKVGSIIEGVVGNAGEGVLSGVSQGDGHTITIEGSQRLFVNKMPVCHHGHKVLMNVKA
jgi:hypothetical protein